MNRKVSIILPYYNRKKLLQRTLDSFQYFYTTNQLLEIVIVDDCSNEKNRIEDLIKQYSLNILFIRLSEETGDNPCYPYNVGVRRSSGDVIVLSSPEIFHTINMFEITNNFERLTDKIYFQFSVFCLVKEMLNINKKRFYENLGGIKRHFANEWGVWYSHSRLRPSCLNFFSALTRNNYYKLSGFDERFRHGLGYDDDEFKERILKMVDKVIWFDDAVAIHVDHPVANELTLRKNRKVLRITRETTYKFNDNWGRE